MEGGYNTGPLKFRHKSLSFISCLLWSFLQYLLTKSCSFCMGSGSPSRPQVSISLPSYTLMIRSAVFMRKQLHKGGHKSKSRTQLETEEEQTWNTSPTRLDWSHTSMLGTPVYLLLVLTCLCVQIQLIWWQWCCLCLLWLWTKPQAPECLCLTLRSATTNRTRLSHLYHYQI